MKLLFEALEKLVAIESLHVLTACTNIKVSWGTTCRAPQQAPFFAISDSAKIYQNRRSQYAANCRPEVLYHTISRRAVGCFGSRSFCHALRNNIAMADFRSAREVARSVTINDLNCRHRKLNPFTQTLWCYIASPVEGSSRMTPEAGQGLHILHRR